MIDVTRTVTKQWLDVYKTRAEAKQFKIWRSNVFTDSLLQQAKNRHKKHQKLNKNRAKLHKSSNKILHKRSKTKKKNQKINKNQKKLERLNKMKKK